jgi:small ligand-binding sensory domain FIST
MATQAGAGLSENPDTVEAAAEAAREALDAAGVPAHADWAVVFATMPHRARFADLLAEVQRLTGAAVVSGCSGAGVLAGGREVEGGPAVAVLAARSDRIAADAHIEPAGDDQGRAAAGALARRAGPGAGLLVAFPDPFAIRLDAMLSEIESGAPGLRMVGAAAAGGIPPSGTFQFCGRNVATGSLAALRLAGIEVAIGVTQGCQPLGPPCRVTRAHDNVVLELDGRPALEVLRGRLPAGIGESLGRLGGHLFIGLPPDRSQTAIEPGEYLVRPLFAVDPARGALLLGDEVRDGQPLAIVLRDAGAARDDLKAMLDRLAGAGGAAPWEFGLYFNCAGRGAALHGLPGVDSAYIARQFPRLPVAGVFGNAEIAPLRGRNCLFTYTGVLALCREGHGGA